jgi:16S rRNA (adenine1518-N6/adenine1519-N6)-dimethyltransferase
MRRKARETRGSGNTKTPHSSSSQAAARPPANAGGSDNITFHPSKRLGQNFLTDQRIVQRIVEALAPKADETIVEIGPGRGSLTKSLLEKAGHLVAIEFDRNLIPLLEESFGSKKNFRLVHNDVLVTDLCDVIRPASEARVVANLPYNIATAILQRLIEQRHCLTEMVLMLQKEVVDRITARPGSGERGYLSVFVEGYCQTEKLFDVAPSSFRPAPKIWSTVLRLVLRPRLAVDVQNEKLLWQVVSAGFLQRRKTILNNLRNAPSPLQEIVKSHGGAGIVLCQAEVELQRRAETLTLDEWARIARALQ